MTVRIYKRVIDCPDRRLRLRFKRLKADRSIHANWECPSAAQNRDARARNCRWRRQL